MLLASSILYLPYCIHCLFIHCAEHFVVTLNPETLIVDFWVFYYFFDNFLSSIFFFLFLELLFVKIRLLESIL